MNEEGICRDNAKLQVKLQPRRLRTREQHSQGGPRGRSRVRGAGPGSEGWVRGAGPGSEGWVQGPRGGSRVRGVGPRGGSRVRGAGPGSEGWVRGAGPGSEGWVQGPYGSVQSHKNQKWRILDAMHRACSREGEARCGTSPLGCRQSEVSHFGSLRKNLCAKMERTHATQAAGPWIPQRNST